MKYENRIKINTTEKQNREQYKEKKTNSQENEQDEKKNKIPNETEILIFSNYIAYTLEYSHFKLELKL